MIQGPITNATLDMVKTADAILFEALGIILLITSAIRKTRNRHFKTSERTRVIRKH